MTISGNVNAQTGNANGAADQVFALSAMARVTASFVATSMFVSYAKALARVESARTA